MQSLELKVKVKSLAVEARIIRKEERKQLHAGRWALKHQDSSAPSFFLEREKLREHRVGKLRKASRHSHIAHALIKGVAYKDIEQCKPDNLPNWDSICAMLIKYGGYTKAEADSVAKNARQR